MTLDEHSSSGLYYTNKMGRLFLQALEETMGRQGLNALLNHTQRPFFITELPPDNLEREFDFAHVACLNQGLEELYGPRGARGLAVRSGRAFFRLGREEFGVLAGLGDLALRAMPLHTKLKLGLRAVTRIFSQFSDQDGSIEEVRLYYLYHVIQCPVCWGRRAQQPIDHFHVGVLEETMRWASRDLDFRVVQTQCAAMGDGHCVFRIDKEPLK